MDYIVWRVFFSHTNIIHFKEIHFFLLVTFQISNSPQNLSIGHFHPAFSFFFSSLSFLFLSYFTKFVKIPNTR